jgi:glycosyltransferase involved in cell wall biosynthesis
VRPPPPGNGGPPRPVRGASGDRDAPAGDRALRVVLLSKALVVGAYQRKAELLAAEGDIDLTVVVPPLWRDGTLVRRLERRHTDGYRLVETPIVRPGDFHLHWYPRFGRLLADVRPDVVHVDEEPYNLATFLALRAARRRGARTLFFTWQNLRRRYPPPFAWFERHAYRQAAGAIAGSRTAGEVLRAKGYDGPLWHIPQVGVDADDFRPADVPPPPRPFTIGYAGRLVPAKGVDLLVDAAAALAGDWRLVIVGEGEARSALEARIAARGIGARVTFTPWLPSDRLIEAMACGVPCIGSDSGEIPHVLGDAGLVFAEGDAGALRAHLAALVASGEARAALGRAGRARVLAHFTMARVASETAAVYRAIAAAPVRALAFAGADQPSPPGQLDAENATALPRPCSPGRPGV